jgi:hypothetical protein
MRRNFWRSLAAVLVGNAIYFGVERFPPPRAQYQLYQIDWGLAVDFWVCLACYGSSAEPGFPFWTFRSQSVYPKPPSSDPVSCIYSSGSRVHPRKEGLPPRPQYPNQDFDFGFLIGLSLSQNAALQ